MWVKRLLSYLFLTKEMKYFFLCSSFNTQAFKPINGHISFICIKSFLKSSKTGRHKECLYTSSPRSWLFWPCLLVPKPPYMTFFFFLKLLRQSVTVRLLSENCLKLPGFFIYFKCFALNAFNSIYLPNTPFFQ